MRAAGPVDVHRPEASDAAHLRIDRRLGQRRRDRRIHRIAAGGEHLRPRFHRLRLCGADHSRHGIPSIDPAPQSARAARLLPVLDSIALDARSRGPRNQPMALLDCHQVTRSFYGVHALNGVDLTVEPRRITGLIGPNGAGKTTLVQLHLRARAGRLRAASCSTATTSPRWRPDRISAVGLVRTFQIARGIPRLSVLENLLLYGPRQPGESLGAALLRTRAMLARETALLPARARDRGAAQPDARARHAGRRALGRTEEAARDRPRADGRAAPAAARRAGRRRQSDARARDRRAPARRSSPRASPSC